MSYANATIVGNIGREVESKTIPSGSTVHEFSVCANLGWGEQKRAEWFDCQAWAGKNGDRWKNVLPYLLKGSTVLIEAEPRTEKWIDKKDGTERKAIRWQVSEIRLMGGKKGERGAQQDLPSQGSFAGETPATPAGNGWDDLPY
jgi:single-strand DNA-binding protein